MDNNQDQLPMLPDPMEDQPATLPTPVETAAPVAPVVQAKPTRNYLRMGLIFGGVVIVLLLTLFGSRLVDLLNLRGSKAAQTIILQGQEFMNTNSEAKLGAPNSTSPMYPSSDLFTVPTTGPYVNQLILKTLATAE